MRDEGAVPATIAVVAGEVADRARRRRARGAGAGRRLREGGAARPRPGDRRAAARRRRPWPRPPTSPRGPAIRVFATGGLGGVHREARESWDESADLTTLARTGVTIVCSGVKSILDVGATLERLETLNVCVLGYGTDRFPGFYLADSGFAVAWRVDTPDEVAGVMRAQADVGLGRPRDRRRRTRCPPREQVDPALHDRVLTESLAEAAARGDPRRRDDAVPARPLPPRDRRRDARRRTSRSCAATPRSPRGSRAPPPDEPDRRRRRRHARRRRDARCADRARQRRARRDRRARRRRGGERRRVARAGRRRRDADRPRRRRPRGPRRRRRAARGRGRPPASVDPERPTGTCLVLVEPGGERTMLPDPGANAALVAEPAAAGRDATCTSPATRCCGRARAPRRGRCSRPRARRRRDRLGRPVERGAARRARARRVPRLGRRASTCCCPTATRRPC